MPPHPTPAVVGAGFSGLSVARFFARLGCEPYIYEEHSRVGFPKHCTGIVSTETLHSIGQPAEKCHLHSYHRITVEGSRPPGFTVEHRNIAHMLDRVCLENEMLAEAVRNGAQYHPRTRVAGVKPLNPPEGGVALAMEAGTREALHHSAVLALGSRPEPLHPLLRQERRPPVPGVNMVIHAEHPLDPGEIRVFFDHRLAPGFFAWAVPMGGDKLVLGLATQDPGALRNGVRRLAKEKLGLGNYELVEAYGGPVNRGPPLRRLREGRVLLAGDAGGLVKPVTGGGLYPMAKATAAPRREIGCGEAFELLAARLEHVRRELSRHYRVARLLHDPGSQAFIDKAVEIARREKLGEIIGERMGFDSHHLLARVVLGKPRAALRLALAAGWRGLSLLL